MIQCESWCDDCHTASCQKQLWVSDLAVVGHQEELDVLLPLEDGDALEDRGAEESQVGQLTRPVWSGLEAPPTPERLRPVGGS